MTVIVCESNFRAAGKLTVTTSHFTPDPCTAISENEDREARFWDLVVSEIRVAVVPEDQAVVGLSTE